MSKQNKNFKRSKNFKAKSKSWESKDEAYRGDRSKDNDASWYNRSVQLVKDSAAYTFDYPAGIAIPTIVSNEGYYLPAISQIRIAESVGHSIDVKSTINYTTQSLFTFLRKGLTASAPYTAADVGLYFLTADKIFSTWAHLMRAYGVASCYSTRDRYLPDKLLDALGFHPGDVHSHMADFRAQINIMAVRINSIPVPNVMTLFNRHFTMFSNVFADSNDPKAQLYVYTPEYYGKFFENADDAVPSELRMIKVNSGSGYAHDVEWWINVLDELVTSFMHSSTFGFISGDILKVYDAGTMFSVTPLPETFLIAPIYNEEWLNQLHNAVVFNQVSNVSIQQHVQDDGLSFLYQSIQVDPNDELCAAKYIYGMECGRLINTNLSNPTNDAIMVMTRLAPVVGMTSSNVMYVAYSGSEICTGWQIYSGEILEGTDGTISTYYSDQPGGGILPNAWKLCRISQFNWHPLIICAYAETDVSEGGIWDKYQYFGDIDNFAIIPAAGLMRMHEVALTSEFGLPSASLWK